MDQLAEVVAAEVPAKEILKMRIIAVERREQQQ
jgi:hypothetical protein